MDMHQDTITDILNSLAKEMPQERNPVWIEEMQIFTEARRREMTDDETKATLNQLWAEGRIKVHQGLNQKIITWRVD